MITIDTSCECNFLEWRQHIMPPIKISIDKKFHTFYYMPYKRIYQQWNYELYAPQLNICLLFFGT